MYQNQVRGNLFNSHYNRHKGLTSVLFCHRGVSGIAYCAVTPWGVSRLYWGPISKDRCMATSAVHTSEELTSTQCIWEAWRTSRCWWSTTVTQWLVLSIHGLVMGCVNLSGHRMGFPKLWNGLKSCLDLECYWRMCWKNNCLPLCRGKMKMHLIKILAIHQPENSLCDNAIWNNEMYLEADYLFAAAETIELIEITPRIVLCKHTFHVHFPIRNIWNHCT